MTNIFKQLRFGTLLRDAANAPDFFNQTHVIFGGTGAVGGSTALRMVSFFEEAILIKKPTEYFFRVVVTGLTRSELRGFTTRLHQLHQRDHGTNPEALEGIGYRTKGGVEIQLALFSADVPIPELKMAAKEGVDIAGAAFLKNRGLSETTPTHERTAALTNEINNIETGPFAQFLIKLKEDHPEIGDQYRSVVVGIPLPSVATYHSGLLERFGRHMGMESKNDLNELKSNYLKEFPKDLAYVAKNLAEDVLVAHTTGVGGMYDEDETGRRTIRLGFAHSASGDKLREKAAFADEMTLEYSKNNIKMLVTAAAIGIDSILSRTSPPLKNDIRQRLKQVNEASENPLVPNEDLKKKNVHIYEPETLDLSSPLDRSLEFKKGDPLIMDQMIRSGENGYFSVSNADALYRIMRVASDSELGMVLARTAVFGDSPQYSRFINNICYYTETDHSRQVFDLLEQPPLQASQLSGLQPKALQDLGSSKHQGELHTLGLLILLHRLKTLNLDGIKFHVNLDSFDAESYFEDNSSALTLGEAAKIDMQSLAKDLRTLVGAKTADDLTGFQRIFHNYPERRVAAEKVLALVIQSVWAIPSLGSPIIYEAEDGRTMIRAGFYVAPLDTVITHKNSLLSGMHKAFKETDLPDTDEEFQRFMDFQFTNNGFVDLRPRATLITCRQATGSLEGKVMVFHDQKSFVEALSTLEPYSYFTSSGLIALMVRLKGLARHAQSLDLSLGTGNDFRAHFINNEAGRVPLVPGVVEAFRMVSEGLEKNTGTERLDGLWGYGWPPPRN